ncbi:MAG: Holliday junction branch migration protein RuvA [Campylobacteraceae bacterium]|nr:Holliday junction branch migration protein RuvA [Campylobacteraceae bacterium]
MIVALEGKLVHKEPTFIHLEISSGVTYRITVSLFTSSELKSDKARLKITQIFREDAQLLFGFLNSDEQRMFETVIKLNGIGPTTGMAICSTLTPENFSKALFQNDVDAFRAVPGIGPKSAKRILVELSDFTLNSNETPMGITRQEAVLALESLGFKKERIKKVLLTCEESDTAALVKEALRKLT